PQVEGAVGLLVLGRGGVRAAAAGVVALARVLLAVARNIVSLLAAVAAAGALPALAALLRRRLPLPLSLRAARRPLPARFVLVVLILVVLRGRVVLVLGPLQQGVDVLEDLALQGPCALAQLAVAQAVLGGAGVAGDALQGLPLLAPVVWRLRLLPGVEAL